MHFSIKSTDLITSTALVRKALPANPQAPILEGLHLLVDQDQLTLTANDLQMAIRTTVPCKVVMNGEHVVNGKLFAELVQKFPAEDVEIEYRDEQLLIRSATMEFFLNTISEDTFPEYPLCETKVLTISSRELQHLIKSSAFATSNDDHQPIFSGILVEIKDHKINFIATDSNRLSFIQAKIDTPLVNDQSFIIPKQNLVELSNCLPNKETDIEMLSGNNQLVFKFGNTIFATRLIDGNFPNYQSVIFTEQKTLLKINRTQFIQALERAAILGRIDGAPVILKAEDGFLEILTTSKSGQSQEQYKIEHSGPKEEAAFSPKFILDMLKILDDEQVEFRFEKSRQALLKAVDSDQHLYILMPVRI